MDVLSAYHGIASGSPCVVPSRESISPPPQINSLDDNNNNNNNNNNNSYNNNKDNNNDNSNNNNDLEGKTGLPGEKPLGANVRTDNKLNPHMASTLGFEPGPHSCEASALTTAPSLAPRYYNFLCFSVF